MQREVPGTVLMPLKFSQPSGAEGIGERGGAAELVKRPVGSFEYICSRLASPLLEFVLLASSKPSSPLSRTACAFLF